MLKRAAFSATYQTVWVAGPCIEHVKGIKSVSDTIDIVGNVGLATEVQYKGKRAGG